MSLLKPTISPIFRCKDIHSSSILYDIFNNLDIYEQSGYIQISDARISILLQSSTFQYFRHSWLKWLYTDAKISILLQSSTTFSLFRHSWLKWLYTDARISILLQSSTTFPIFRHLWLKGYGSLDVNSYFDLDHIFLN